jgi:hypothetical protein
MAKILNTHKFDKLIKQELERLDNPDNPDNPDNLSKSKYRKEFEMLNKAYEQIKLMSKY